MKTRKMLSKIFCALLVMALIATSAPLMGFATDEVLTSKPTYIINYDGGVRTCYEKVEDDNAVYEIYRKTPDTDYVMIGTSTASKSGIVQFLDDTTEHLETYTYDVAVNGGELSGSPLTIEYISTPNFTATISSEGLKINIEPLEGVDYYRVMRNDGVSPVLQCIAIIDASEEPVYNDVNVLPDDYQYKYMVRAAHNDNFSYYHTQDAAILSSGIKGLANVNGGVKVSYDKVEGAKGYAVFRRTDDTDWVQATIFNAATYFYIVDYSAVSGTIYYYTVASIKEDGTMVYNADYKKIMYLEDPSVFLSIGDDGIVVDFTPVNGADFYEVLRSPADKSEFKCVGRVNGDDLCTFTDTTAVEGESYKYAVRARNNSTGVMYAGYMKEKAIDYALFVEDTEETVVIAPADDTTATTVDTTTPADTTAATDTTAAADDVAAAEKTVTDILAQVFAFIGQLLTKLGVDASFLDGVLPVINTIFGFVNNIISIAG